MIKWLRKSIIRQQDVNSIFYDFHYCPNYTQTTQQLNVGLPRYLTVNSLPGRTSTKARTNINQTNRPIVR
nr:hypothetical protein [Escherichia coli]